MPNLSQIVGRPLPDRGMPTGTVSVRVARKMPANAVAGAEVSAIIKNAGGDLRRRALKTDDSGRVLFEGMAPGDEFHAEVNVDGEQLQTETFTMPSEGGIRTMLIRRRRGRRRRAAAEPEGEAAAGEGSPAGAGKDQRASPWARPPASRRRTRRCPSGRWRSACCDESGRADRQPPRAAGHGRTSRARSTSRAARATRPAPRASPSLPAGKQTGYAAVIEWHGLRLEHVAVRDARERRRARRDPRAGAHRRSVGDHDRRGRPHRRPDGRGPAADPRVAARSRTRSDEMFDPAPGALEIPLPTGFASAQPQENERKIDVRQNHGVAVHGPIVPKRVAARRGRQRTSGQRSACSASCFPTTATRTTSRSRCRTASGRRRLITDQKVAGLTVSGPGVGAREERVLGGRKYWVMPVAADRRRAAR